MRHARLFAFSALFALSALAVSACVVDRSKYEFDDDKFDALRSGGTKATGGKKNGGGEGGEPSTSSGGRKNNGSGGVAGETGDDSGAGGAPQTVQTCLTGDLECNGKQLEICTGESYIAVGKPCEFVCANDQCTGVCAPGAHECVNETAQRVCDENGQWVTEPCDFACVGDQCGGVCAPGDRQCGNPDGGLIPVEVCDATGTWKGTTTICEACEDGQCTGGCSQGDTQCGTTEQGDPAVLTCPENGADWSEATITACENQACVDGACVGECRPTDTTCNGKIYRTCSATGTWSDTTCPFVCTEGVGCTGVCVPGTEMCDGNVVLRCTAQGTWEKHEVCGRDTPLCVHLSDIDKACGQCNPPKKGEANNFCYMDNVVTCTSKGMLSTLQDCSATVINGLCYAGACFNGKSCPASGVNGCVDKATGWVCPIKGKARAVCECDCSNGLSCAEGC
ncbi:MAG: hypothetical protein B6A08_11470 [Sorangiineae bacterium NIC37A_2]|nr:MAG: hypothetical protein B6A08_11470 [Sorangiineae bacterium NIC37A_2]